MHRIVRIATSKGYSRCSREKPNKMLFQTLLPLENTVSSRDTCFASMTIHDLPFNDTALTKERSNGDPSRLFFIQDQSTRFSKIIMKLREKNVYKIRLRLLRTYSGRNKFPHIPTSLLSEISSSMCYLIDI